MQFFKVCLFTWGTVHRPIVLFLDSLDHLSNDDNGLKLTWLPMKNLPHTLKVVVTTQPEVGENNEELVCFKVIKAAVSANVANEGSDAGAIATYIEVCPLEYDEGKTILTAWMARNAFVVLFVCFVCFVAFVCFRESAQRTLMGYCIHSTSAFSRGAAACCPPVYADVGAVFWC